MNLSVSAKPDAILDKQIRAAIKAGVHFVASAGNRHVEARRFPAGSECSCLKSMNFHGLTLH